MSTTEALFETYSNQQFYSSLFTSHVDGHCDWNTGTDDDVYHTDKHEDCNSL